MHGYATGNPYPVEFLQASSKIDLAVGYEHQPIDQHNQNPAHSQFRNIAQVSWDMFMQQNLAKHKLVM